MASRIAKSLNIAAAILGLFCACTMIYGIYNYPYAPIRQRSGTFQDKRGNLFSESEYAGFVRWEYALFISGAGTFALVFAGLLFTRKGRKGTSDDRIE